MNAPWLPIGYTLQTGILSGKRLSVGDGYQIISCSGHQRIALLVEAQLERYWMEIGLFEKNELSRTRFGDREIAFLLADKSGLELLSECDRPECFTDVQAVAMSIRRTRSKGITISLADSIFYEKALLLLPIWGSGDALKDDVLLGRYISGGVPISIHSKRRVLNFAPWMNSEQVDQLSSAITLVTPLEPSLGEVTASKTLFTLNGRPSLEAFFREHIIDIVENSERYDAMGISFPSAVVLHGPPGCGKTYAIERLAEYLDWPCFDISSGSIGSPYLHDTGRKIGQVFDKARESAPSLIVIDEMEAFLADREIGSGLSSHHLEEVAEFLRCIPEALKHHVLVIGMTNRIDLIDAAILRRGRFDHVISVSMPSEIEIISLLEALLKEKPCKLSLDLGRVSSLLAGRALSDAAFVVREAARLTAKAGNKAIDDESLTRAVASLPSVELKKKAPPIGFQAK